jgi:hypothetical protein
MHVIQQYMHVELDLLGGDKLQALPLGFVYMHIKFGALAAVS